MSSPIPGGSTYQPTRSGSRPRDQPGPSRRTHTTGPACSRPHSTKTKTTQLRQRRPTPSPHPSSTSLPKILTRRAPQPARTSCPRSCKRRTILGLAARQQACSNNRRKTQQGWKQEHWECWDYSTSCRPSHQQSSSHPDSSPDRHSSPRHHP